MSLQGLFPPLIEHKSRYTWTIRGLEGPKSLDRVRSRQYPAAKAGSMQQRPENRLYDLYRRAVFIKYSDDGYI